MSDSGFLRWDRQFHVRQRAFRYAADLLAGRKHAARLRVTGMKNRQRQLARDEEREEAAQSLACLIEAYVEMRPYAGTGL